VSDPASAAILAAVEPLAMAHYPTVVTGQRKGFTAFNREILSSLDPSRSAARRHVLGFAVTPDADPGWSRPRNEGWSERLKSKLELDGPAQVDAGIAALLRQAWERS